jgi:hypothetical protein
MYCWFLVAEHDSGQHYREGRRAGVMCAQLFLQGREECPAMEGENMEQTVPIRLPNGEHALIQLERPIDRGGPAAGLRAIPEQLEGDKLKRTISGLGALLHQSISEIPKATRVSAELGLNLTYENGQFIAVIVRGKVEATLKITIEWSSPANSKS